jgi:hypothetical protein
MSPDFRFSPLTPEKIFRRAITTRNQTRTEEDHMVLLPLIHVAVPVGIMHSSVATAARYAGLTLYTDSTLYGFSC